MFRDYFPNAKIWGLDIDPKFEIHDERIDVLIGDQKDQKVLEHISEVGPFDVIIDDAGHEFKEQSASFENLWTCLKPNGIYFIEDLQFNDEIVKYLAGLVSPDTVKKKNDIKSISFYRNIAVLEKAVREEDE
jgi:hypothetical protein